MASVAAALAQAPWSAASSARPRQRDRSGRTGSAARKRAGERDEPGHRDEGELEGHVHERAGVEGEQDERGHRQRRGGVGPAPEQDRGEDQAGGDGRAERRARTRRWRPRRGRSPGGRPAAAARRTSSARRQRARRGGGAPGGRARLPSATTARWRPETESTWASPLRAKRSRVAASTGDSSPAPMARTSAASGSGQHPRAVPRRSAIRAAATRGEGRGRGRAGRRGSRPGLAGDPVGADGDGAVAAPGVPGSSWARGARPTGAPGRPGRGVATRSGAETSTRPSRRPRRGSGPGPPACRGMETTSPRRVSDPRNGGWLDAVEAAARDPAGRREGEGGGRRPRPAATAGDDSCQDAGNVPGFKEMAAPAPAAKAARRDLHLAEIPQESAQQIERFLQY